MVFVCLLPCPLLPPTPHYSLSPGAGTVNASIKIQYKNHIYIQINKRQRGEREINKMLLSPTSLSQMETSRDI